MFRLSFFIFTIALGITFHSVAAAAAEPGKIAVKSSKNKKKAASISPAAAAKQLKAMGISKSGYDAALQNAITSHDDFKKLRLLVAAGADITTPRTWKQLEEATPDTILQQKWTPLDAALLVSNERAVRLLLKSPGISIKEWTPLEQAVCQGNAESVTKLLDEGADAFARGNSSTLPICLAAILGKKSCTEAILYHKDSKRKAEKAKQKSQDLRSRLEKQAVALLTKGAKDLEHELMYGQFLADAFHKGSIAEVTLALLYPKRQWDAPATTNNALSTWRYLFNEASSSDFSTNRGLHKMQMLLKISKPDIPEAYVAVLKNDMKTLQKCVSGTSHEQLNGEPFCLEPILFYAIKSGNKKAVDILLAAGISPNQETHRVTNGIIENMLMIAAKNKQLPIFKKLVQAGADIYHNADHDSTFLDEAMRKGWVECIEYVLSLPHLSQDIARPLTTAVLRKDYASLQSIVDKEDARNNIYAFRDAMSYCILTNDAKGLKIMAPVLHGQTQQQQYLFDQARELKREHLIKVMQGES